MKAINNYVAAFFYNTDLNGGDLMKHIWALVLVIATLSMSSQVLSKVGEDGDFDQVIVFTADGTLTSPDPFSLMVPDPDAIGLREVLNWNDEQVLEFQSNAEILFRDKFGIDFTDIPANSDGVKEIPGVAMFLNVRFSPEAGYRAIYMGKKGVDRPVDTMGYIAIITGMNVKYHGEFGGEEGSPAFPGEILAFGVYNIMDNEDEKDDDDEDENDGDIVFFQQSTPGRYSPEGLIGIFCDISSPEWGDGKGEGSTAVTLLPDGRAHVFIRNILAFPGRRSFAQ